MAKPDALSLILPSPTLFVALESCSRFIRYYGGIQKDSWPWDFDDSEMMTLGTFGRKEWKGVVSRMGTMGVLCRNAEQSNNNSCLARAGSFLITFLVRAGHG
jgi:hypothetical protein